MPSRLLILSDGKPGHVNQSIAFARHLGYDYDLCKVAWRQQPWSKGLSYLADRLRIYSPSLFRAEPYGSGYVAVVSTGSDTWYANKVIARELGCKSAVMMLPQGYRYDYDLIIAQQHDRPPQQENLLSLPVNLNYVDPQGLVTPETGKRYISIIVGGDSAHGKLDAALLKKQLEEIFRLFPDHARWLTTSRRTSAEIEQMLQQFSFDRAVYYSQEPMNPIPDFLQHSEVVFLTADSSSMVSEAVSFGKAAVEVLPLVEGLVPQGKLATLIGQLQRQGCLHLFDGRLGNATEKISLNALVKEAKQKFL